MQYEELLKKAKASMPDTQKEETRLDIPSPFVSYAGRQTIIKNFPDIAKTIRREPSHIAKFLFKELGVPGTLSGIELHLQGKVYASMIKQRIDEYVELYVNCHECKKPDTSISKSGKVYSLKCEACGAKRTCPAI